MQEEEDLIFVFARNKKGIDQQGNMLFFVVRPWGGVGNESIRKFN